MEVVPTVLKGVIYDTSLRILYYPDNGLQSSLERIYSSIPVIKGVPDVSDVYHVSRPTYAMNYLHSCIGHAYFDTTLPLLSILHEYDPSILSDRGFQLFVIKDRFQEYATNDALIRYLDEWYTKTVDYEASTYKGVYAHFHRCFSDAPVIFERSFNANRYIKFDTLIYGGNADWQRSIHNCAAKYPERRPTPVSTDDEIRAWNRVGKEVFAKYIGIQPKQVSESPKILFVSRRGYREFTSKTLSRLRFILDAEPIFLEEYTFAEQIQMFIDADIVVSPHGSGLCHLTWCAPGTRVIEIFASNDSRKIIFQSLSEMSGLDYKRIECSDAKITTDDPIEVPEGVFGEIMQLVSDHYLRPQ